MSKTTALILIGLFIFGLACSDNPVSTSTINGSQNLITVNREIPNFSAIKNRLVANINIQLGPEQEVSLTVDDNIADYIVLSVASSGELVIRTDPGIDLSNYDLTLNLTVTNLISIRQLGTGQITSALSLNVEDLDIELEGAGTINLDLEAENVNTTIEGAGSITLCGSAETHTCNHTGAAVLHAFDLVTMETVISLCGVGYAEVYASEMLEIDFGGVCSLYYRGNPEIVQTGSGVGSIVDSNP